jgi:hypothetical protein
MRRRETGWAGWKSPAPNSSTAKPVQAAARDRRFYEALDQAQQQRLAQM